MSLSLSKMTVSRSGGAQSTGEVAKPAPVATAAPAPIPEATPASTAVPPPDPKAAAAAPVATTPPKEGEGAPKAEPKPGEEASRFAILAKREARILSERESVKAEKAAIAAERKAIADEKARIEKERADEEAQWRADPLKVIERRGSSYKDLTDRVLNEGKPSPADEARMAAEAVLKADAEKRAEEARKAAETAKEEAKTNLENARAGWREEFSEAIKAKPDDYELSNLYPDEAKAIGQEVVEAYFAKHKKILSHDEAATLVEKYLFSEFEKVTKTKKFAKAPPQPQGEPKQPETGSPKKVEADPDTAKPRTITNRWVPAAKKPRSTLTWEEKLERARRV